MLRNLQAVLPESRGFNWRLSGRQNLEFYALLYGLGGPETEARIQELLDFTGLSARGEDSYQSYSTGMQRRLLLCRALIRDTPIIVFDEPTAGLDPSGAAEFRDLLIHRLAREEGKTVLLSTHNLQEAEELCDRIAIMDRGRVIALGTPGSVRQLVSERRTLRVTLPAVPFGDDMRRLVTAIEAVAGVAKVDPAVDQGGRLSGIAVILEKEADLSAVLELIARAGINVRSVNTEEPSLEEAFIAITRGNHAEGEGGA